MNLNKYNYLKISVSDDGAFILSFEEKVPCATQNSLDHCSYDYKEHTVVFADIDNEKEAFIAKIKDVLTAKIS